MYRSVTLLWGFGSLGKKGDNKARIFRVLVRVWPVGFLYRPTIPGLGRLRQEGQKFKAFLGCRESSRSLWASYWDCLKIKKKIQERAEEVAQWVVHLPGTCKALGSTPRATNSFFFFFNAQINRSSRTVLTWGLFSALGIEPRASFVLSKHPPTRYIPNLPCFCGFFLHGPFSVLYK